MIGKLAYAMTYSFKSGGGTPDASRATIGVSSTVTQESAGPRGSIKLGDSKGTCEVIIANGRIEHSTMRIAMPMTATMTGPDGSPASVRNEARTTVTLQRIE